MVEQDGVVGWVNATVVLSLTASKALMHLDHCCIVNCQQDIDALGSLL